MKYQRSKLVGRKELPEDRAAFVRLNNAFAGPSTTQGAKVQPSSSHRRLRVVVAGGRTKAG